MWAEFAALAPLPSDGTRSVWGAAEPAEHSRLASAYGCGGHVNRAAVNRMLARAAAAAGARLLTGTRAVVRPDGAGPGHAWTLELAGPDGGLGWQNWITHRPPHRITRRRRR